MNYGLLKMNKDELQQLAHQKELEWKAINDKRSDFYFFFHIIKYWLKNYRIEALEQELKQTAKSLEQEKKNFSQLKEDFKYNLKLLEERDKELGNIESYYSGNSKLRKKFRLNFGYFKL